MRGEDRQQATIFSYLSPEQRVPADHPLRTLRPMVETALQELSGLFDAMYAREGRPSIPPEQLLRALILQLLYSVRSERQLMEQLDYNLGRGTRLGPVPIDTTPTGSSMLHHRFSANC